ncbi:MAG TPA: hypothetical protein PKD58_05755, partial [Candidatus Sumerlaeota bacterium]|nr:hypothetical protein [Candidatus Sumerlaeota bacterium]
IASAPPASWSENQFASCAVAVAGASVGNFATGAAVLSAPLLSFFVDEFTVHAEGRAKESTAANAADTTRMIAQRFNHIA